MNKVNVWYQQNGQIKKVVLDSKELENFSQEHNVVQIKEINRVYLLRPKVTLKEFCEMFSQLDMILKSGIHLYEALDIALKNSQNSKLKEILSSMKDAINSGKPIFQALEKHESIVNTVLIGFFKIAHIKGNTHRMIGAMSKILRLQEKNRALLKSQLSYPLIIAITLCIALGVIFFVVLPKFEYIFTQYALSLPIYTQLLLAVKGAFLYICMGVTISTVFLMSYFKRRYEQESSFALKWDKYRLLKLPMVSRIYFDFQLYMFFLALNVLLKCQYEFNIAMENAMLLLKNKYLLDRIRHINGHIKNGVSIYDSFYKAELFDEVVLSLLSSGEKSSSLPYSVKKIEQYYKHNFKKKIKQFTSLLEPLFLFIVMIVVLWVMLAIFTPIWNMSEMINA
jgi:general secretion pathway protein F